MSVTLRNSKLLLLSQEEPSVTLPPLVPDGIFFKDLTVVMCSDFNLYNRYLAGEDIEVILEQRAECGFNFLRVWTLYNIPGIGNITDKPALYEHYDGFLNICAKHGFYVMFTAYAGSQDVTHWGKLINALRSSTHRNFYIELVNELNHPEGWNWINVNQFDKPDFCLSSHGSKIAGDEVPILPTWDIIDYHTNDISEWQRKVGHNAMEIGLTYNRICLASENTRFPDNCSSKKLAFQTARAAALLASGSCFHSVHGKDSSLWSGLELECAIFWAAGALDVPLSYRKGFYRHRQDLENDVVLRAYSKTINGNDEFITRIDREG